jgi:hypothetical protein
MPDQDKKQSQPTDPSTAPEFNNPDFQAVLKALLAAYQPILEQQLALARNPQQLQKDAQADPPNCVDEFKEANALFGKFLTDDIALRLIPEKNRGQLGPLENWRWCLQHLRCCIIFGWLICRGPRTFRAWAYYVYQYWLCVRESLGTPVSNPPTEEQRADFNTLIGALAKAYKPYLTDQLASVEFPAGIPDEVLNGEIDCFEGQADTCAIFDRLLTTEAAQALLGKAAFAARSQDQNFWFCRCWCLCSICFGCCLARSRNFIDVVYCLIYYFRCLVNCFRPLTCDLTAPTGCVQEQSFLNVGIFRGVEIFGTATGFDCDHYILQWSQGGGPWQSSGIVYPGGAAQGACGVVGGLLGYLSTFPLVSPGLVEIQLCVYSSQPGVAPCCVTIDFQLQRNLVWIQGIEGINAATPPGVFDPTAQLVDGSGTVRSFGTSLRIFGSAVVGGCNGQNIKSYTLSYQQGFTTTIAGAWTQFWQVNYNTPFQLDAGLNYIFEQALTSQWEEFPFSFIDPFPSPHVVCNVVDDYLQQAYWNTQNPVGGFAVQYPDPPVACFEAPSSTWNSTPLALPNCQSGRYTLRLTVEDTMGNKTDNLRWAWFDNKNIYGKIAQIGSITPCATVDLSVFSGGSANCAVPWPAPLEGIAYDEYIEEGNFSVPSDNYGGYALSIQKAGGSAHPIPIPGPGSPPWSGPFIGTSRVGDPGTRCPTAVPPPGPIPPPTNGILALLDMRRLDSICNTNPADSDLVLQRGTVDINGKVITPGECCGFIVYLSVWDNSICPSLPDGRHQVDIAFPFCICNDLPPIVVPGP